MQCLVCAAEAPRVFCRQVLYKYDVEYFRCRNCELLFTEPPYWLGEAYDESIKGIRDTGMVQRNLAIADALARIASRHFDPAGRFLDYGAGTGLLVRIMRDRGFDFRYFDPLAKNIFARGFELGRDYGAEPQFELVTAIEVFEHSADPIDDVTQMLHHADSILFTTELQPSGAGDLADWNYLLPEAGQHVAFYSMTTLKRIAKHFSLRLHSDGYQFHLLTRRILELPHGGLQLIPSALRAKIARRLIRYLEGPAEVGISRPSLVRQDLEAITKRLESESAALSGRARP